MRERFGVVTNCWAAVLDSGARFEGLVNQFCASGFNQIEIRDGEYLRRSSFGALLDGLERVTWNYDFDLWCEICDRIHRGIPLGKAVKQEDTGIIDAAGKFIRKTGEAFFSYAFTFPWLEKSSDISADKRRISMAFRLAILLNPRQPRVRFVSITRGDGIDTDIAVSNLKRFKTLKPAGPAILTFENFWYSPLLFLELAAAAGLPLSYDEANNYLPDGTELCGPEEFWKSVRPEGLASIHLKQRNGEGVLTRLGAGFVDLPAMLSRMEYVGYGGDLLFELAPTEEPLADALHGKEYVLQFLGS